MTVQDLEDQISALMAELQALQSPQDQITTGPGANLQGSQLLKHPTVWDEVGRQGSEDRDPKALALLELRKEIKSEILLLKNEGEKFRTEIHDYKIGLNRTNSFLIAVTLVVVIAFITTLSLVFFDLIKEKDLYAKYSDLYQNYSERNMGLNNKINEQEVEINKFQNQIDILRAKNTYLK